MMQGIKVNKEAAAALSRKIGDFVAVITEAQNADNGTRVGDPAWFQAIDDFARYVQQDTSVWPLMLPRRVLAEVRNELDAIQRKSHLVQLLHRKTDADALRMLSTRIRDAFDILKVAVRPPLRARSSDRGAQVRANVDMAQYAGVIGNAFDHIAESLGTVQTAQTRPALPPPLSRYFGRAVETETVIGTLTAIPRAFVGVLGGPGMGKTSLAISVLHDPAIVAHFGARRYFIACDAAEDLSSLLHAICAPFGVSLENANAAWKSLLEILAGAPSLLVLDNLESVWEAQLCRQEAEDMLAFLASVETVSCIITLRGSELPQGPAWTLPHLPPLAPLGDQAALQLFASISDVADGNGDVNILLSSLGNIPLAVSLLAYLAQYESPLSLLLLWNETRTAMLKRSHGADHLTSLDVSIELSVKSPRLSAQPSAIIILSLLSLLPQGVSDSDFMAWACEIPDSSVALSALLRTALVYRTSTRIYVLPPIREYICSNYKPTQHPLSMLCAHYFALPGLPLVEDRLAYPELLPEIIPDIQNIHSVILHGLMHLENPAIAVEAALSALILFRHTGLGTADLLPHALNVAQRDQLQELNGDLLWLAATLAMNSRIPGDPTIFCAQAQALYKESGASKKHLIVTFFSLQFKPLPEAIISATELLRIAHENNDSRSIGLANFHLSFAFRKMGNPASSLSHLLDSISAFHHCRPTEYRNLGICLHHASVLYLNRGEIGDISAANESLTEALRYFTSGNMPNLAASVRLGLGELLLDQGHTSTALSNLESALSDKLKMEPQQDPWLSHVLVQAYLTLDKEAAAITLVENWRVALPTDDKRILMWFLLSKAEIAMSQINLDDAEAALFSALSTGIICQRFWDSLPTEVNMGLARVLRRIGTVQHFRGNSEEACTYYIASTAICRTRWQIETIRALVGLVQVFDDATSENILCAVMLPLMRWGFRPLLADALLHSAHIALRRNQNKLAHHQAGKASRYFEETGDIHAYHRAQSFLEICE